MTRCFRNWRLCALTILLLAPSLTAAQPSVIPAEDIAAPPPSASPSDERVDAEEELIFLSMRFKPISELGVDINEPSGKLPHNFALQRARQDPTPAGAVLLRGWPVVDCQWKATGFCHNPLYFEEVNAERYGYGCCNCLQSGVSAVHFFGTIPALPYLMAADCPCECVYTLGHYRPGNCNPWRRHCWPCRLDAAAVEAGAVVGLIALIP